MSNKKLLVDIVNLNAEASCLSTKRWLRALEGGTNSEIYRILNLYVEEDLKICVGIVGSTLAEIEELNPECIDLINNHPQNFEILIRPFIHSLSILWSDETFTYNYKLGKKYIESVFSNCINWYLPPEFALRNSHIYQLENNNCEGTFIHPKRVKKDTKSALPIGLFTLSSIQNINISCINFTENYDSYYLDQMQIFHSKIRFEEDLIYGWRDGESPFFLPESVEREEIFVQNSMNDFERIFLSESLKANQVQDKPIVHSYPQNSLLPWLGNFRLYWFITEIKRLENNFASLSEVKKKLFLNLLNSDILSSIEKSNVNIKLKGIKSNNDATISYLIKRKERNLDAEELLYLILRSNDSQINTFLRSTDSAFSLRINSRLKALHKHQLY